MGIYFETTTVAEDAQCILEGIAKGEITTDYRLVQTADDSICQDDKTLVWISNDDPLQHLVSSNYKDTVVINNIKGKLTETGCSYIRKCLIHKARVGSTLDGPSSSN